MNNKINAHLLFVSENRYILVNSETHVKFGEIIKYSNPMSQKYKFEIACSTISFNSIYITDEDNIYTISEVVNFLNLKFSEKINIDNNLHLYSVNSPCNKNIQVDMNFIYNNYLIFESYSNTIRTVIENYNVFSIIELNNNGKDNFKIDIENFQPDGIFKEYHKELLEIASEFNLKSNHFNKVEQIYYINELFKSKNTINLKVNTIYLNDGSSIKNQQEKLEESLLK